MTSQVAVLKTPQKSPISIEKFIYLLVLGFTIISMLCLAIAHMTGATWRYFCNADGDSSQLTLALIECVLGIVVIHAPKMVSKLLKIKMPDVLCIAFYLFILCAIPLGEVFSFYYRFSFWDSILHFSSGIMLWMLGSLFLVHYLRKSECANLITPAFVGIVALFFAVSIGVVWEIYEFAMDSLFGMNMQKFMLEDGTALVGNAALFDTMKDLIFDFFGAVVAAIVLAPSLKNKKGWFHSFGQNRKSGRVGVLCAKENALPESA